MPTGGSLGLSPGSGCCLQLPASVHAEGQQWPSDGWVLATRVWDVLFSRCPLLALPSLGHDRHLGSKPEDRSCLSVCLSASR